MKTPRTWINAIVMVLALTPLTACNLFEPGNSPGSRRGSINDQQQVASAEQLIEQGRYSEALLLLEEAIDRNPALTEAHVSLGQIRLEQGDPETAERDFRRAVATLSESDPVDTQFDAQYGHGQALQALNRLTEAVRAYLRALSVK
ncbi:MAG: tetratricopeptide repeat protein, partial [Planctomycetota bacterium]